MIRLALKTWWTRTRRAVKTRWTRPAGGRELLALALPLIISTASWTVMNFIDRMFLLWHSTDAMAAAMPAGMLYYTVICYPLGVAAYVNTFVAQYHGAGRPERIGVAVWQGVWLGVLTAPLILLTIPVIPLVFQLSGHDPQVAALETTYYQIATAAGGASVIAAAMSSFFSGRGETRVVMIVDTIAAGINIVLDYAWIFGHWGFPAAGMAGAAWATVVALWARVLMYGWIMLWPVYRQKYQMLAGCRFDRVLWQRLLRFGGPNGLQFLVEVAAFTLFLLLVGRLGREAAAATSLAFNVNGIAFVPMIGLGVAVSTIVGQYLGRDRADLASRATWTSFWMAACYMGFLSLLYVLVPDAFLAGHASGADPQAFATLRDMTVVLLRFVAAYSLFDAMSLVFVGAIKGAGDTRFVLWTHASIAPFPLLAGWLGITRFGYGLNWCWLMLTLWACVLGLTFLARFLHGRWRSMRVIEPELLGHPKPLAEPAATCSAE
jgi:MATE family multidrug resistance protein